MAQFGGVVKNIPILTKKIEGFLAEDSYVRFAPHLKIIAGTMLFYCCCCFKMQPNFVVVVAALVQTVVLMRLYCIVD